MSIFKSTFKPYVCRQINTRQDLLSSEVRPTYFSKYVSAKAPWARMTSLVDYKGTSNLARKYVLMGGTLLTQKLSGQNGQVDYLQSLMSGINKAPGVAAAYGDLGDKSMYGKRPMPGIESISTKSLSAYGSLRSATINFYAWDKKQLEDLEILFMRPGYYVFLEWGWSMYLDSNTVTDTKDSRSDTNSFNIKTDITKNILKENDGYIDLFGRDYTENQLYDQLDTLKHRYSGNYDGMLGKVYNFTWEFLPNGGYYCTTTLMSVGEVLDSIKISSISTQKFGENQQATYQNTSFGLFLNRLSGYAIDVQNDSIIQEYVKGAANNQAIDNSIHKLRIPGQPVNIIQFAFFLYMLRNQVNLFDDKQNPLVDIEIPVYNDKNMGNGLCIASEDSVSVNPKICMVHNPRAKFVCGNYEGFSINLVGPPTAAIFKEFLQAESTLGVIGNIYFNVNYLKSTYMNLLKNGDVKLGDYIREILRGANLSLGNINEFDIFTIDSRAAIIDKQYTEIPSETRKAKKFQINLSGNNTAVKTSKIQSKIFPEQSTLVALAAQSRENVSAVNTSTNVMMNKDIKNRIRYDNAELIDQARIIEKNAQEGTTEEQRQNDVIKREKEAMVSNIISIRDYMQKILSPTFSSLDVESAASSMSSVLNSIILKINSDANYKAVIPISLEIEFEGISGITIGEIFRVNQDILPTSYNAVNLGFIVTNISNIINTSGWNTNITAMICLLDQEDLKKASSLKQIDKKAYNIAVVQTTQKKQEETQEAITTYNFLVAYVADYFSNNTLSLKYELNRKQTTTTIDQFTRIQLTKLEAVNPSIIIRTEKSNIKNVIRSIEGDDTVADNKISQYLTQMAISSLNPLNGTDGKPKIGPVDIVEGGGKQIIGQFISKKESDYDNLGKSVYKGIVMYGQLTNFPGAFTLPVEEDGVTFPFLERHIFNSQIYKSLPQDLQALFAKDYKTMLETITESYGLGFALTETVGNTIFAGGAAVIDIFNRIGGGGSPLSTKAANNYKEIYKSFLNSGKYPFRLIDNYGNSENGNLVPVDKLKFTDNPLIIELK